MATSIKMLSEHVMVESLQAKLSALSIIRAFPDIQGRKVAMLLLDSDENVVGEEQLKLRLTRDPEHREDPHLPLIS
jgi:hypothetical protein